MPVTDLVTKYGGTITSPVSPIINDPITSKYGGTITQPVVAPTPNFATDFLGIQKPDTYFQDALKQAGDFIMNPIQGIGNALGAAGNAIGSAASGAWEANKTAFGDLTNNKSAVQKTADVLHSIGSDAAVLFSPISAAFAAAEQVPVLKEAADVLNMPFAATGKIGDFAAEKFVDVLPIDQQSKDILKPAFGEIGSLAGQILLGGKIVSMVAKGITPDKAMIDSAVADSKAKATIAEQHAQSPEMIATKYGGTYKAPETPTEIKPTESIKPEPTPKGVEPTPTIPKELQPLAQEAQKYKSAEDFLKANKTGTINAESYKNVDESLKSYKPENFPILKREVTLKDGSQIELRQSGEINKYVKTDAKGDIIRDKQGNATYMSADEIKAKNLNEKDTTIIAFDKNGKAVGSASNEWGADGVFVSPSIQRQGLGTELLTELKKQFPAERKIGQMTPAGEALTKSYYNKVTDFYNKAVGGVPKEVKPTEITGNKPSGIAKSIEAKAIEQGITPKLDKLAGYDASTIKEQAQIFTDTINNKGIDEARAILRGEKPLPEGQKGFPFIVSMEAYLKEHPNPELAYELANSPHVSAASEAASQLGLGQNRVQDSFTAKAQEIVKARETRLKSSPEKRATIKRQAKEAMDKINLSEKELGKLESFINDITC